MNKCLLCLFSVSHTTQVRDEMPSKLSKLRREQISRLAKHNPWLYRFRNITCLRLVSKRRFIDDDLNRILLESVHLNTVESSIRWDWMGFRLKLILKLWASASRNPQAGSISLRFTLFMPPLETFNSQSDVYFYLINWLRIPLWRVGVLWRSW